jgi:hypothetical protein
VASLQLVEKPTLQVLVQLVLVQLVLVLVLVLVRLVLVLVLVLVQLVLVQELRMMHCLQLMQRPGAGARGRNQRRPLEGTALRTAGWGTG